MFYVRATERHRLENSWDLYEQHKKQGKCSAKAITSTATAIAPQPGKPKNRESEIVADRGLGAATPSRVGAKAKAKSKQLGKRKSERAKAKAKSKSNAKTTSLAKACDDDCKTKLPRLIEAAKKHLGQAVLAQRLEEFLQDVAEYIE